MGRTPRRPRSQPQLVRESGSAWTTDSNQVLAVKFYPRFLYWLKQLADVWQVPDGNLSETMRRCIDRYAEDPQSPHPWASYRPRRPRAPRTDNPVRPRRVEDPDQPPLEQIPFNPVLTVLQVGQLTSWAEQFQSNRTAIMYEAIWRAGVAEGLIAADSPIDLYAPADSGA